MKVRELLPRVRQLIESGKYKKYSGSYIDPKDRNCRCYYGLVLEALEELGYIKQKYRGVEGEGERITFETTEKGAHLDTTDIKENLDFSVVGIPKQVFLAGPVWDAVYSRSPHWTHVPVNKKMDLWKVNDRSDITLLELQRLVEASA